MGQETKQDTRKALGGGAMLPPQILNPRVTSVMFTTRGALPAAGWQEASTAAF